MCQQVLGSIRAPVEPKSHSFILVILWLEGNWLCHVCYRHLIYHRSLPAINICICFKTCNTFDITDTYIGTWYAVSSLPLFLLYDAHPLYPLRHANLFSFGQRRFWNNTTPIIGDAHWEAQCVFGDFIASHGTHMAKLIASFQISLRLWRKNALCQHHCPQAP